MTDLIDDKSLEFGTRNSQENGSKRNRACKDSKKEIKIVWTSVANG